MKNEAVSGHRITCRAVFALGCFVFIQLVGARRAQAETPSNVERFELLGSLGYGVAVRDVSWTNSEIDPYGVMVGLDFGYTLPFGLRIGTDVNYGFGRRIEYTDWKGEANTTHASSIIWGGSLGYDLLLPSFRLRGAADGGLLLWLVEDGVAPTLYFGPKVALIWQYRTFELGLQTKYLVTVPGVVQVGLVSGARF